MAQALIPGPLGMDTRRTRSDAGTSLLSPTPRPGPVGMDVPSSEDWTLDAPDVPQERRPFTPSKPSVPALTPKGEARPLTTGEIAMARQLFKDSLDYSEVRVHNGEYLPFGLQPDDTAMTPNGEIYFNPAYFLEDFSQAKRLEDRRWFMHEMVHVWQHQLGYWVRLRGAIRIGLSYEYELKSGKTLGDYNMEAQGDLLADYFMLKFMNAPAQMVQTQYMNSLPLFEEVLDAFLKNPSDTANLP